MLCACASESTKQCICNILRHSTAHTKCMLHSYHMHSGPGEGRKAGSARIDDGKDLCFLLHTGLNTDKTNSSSFVQMTQTNRVSSCLAGSHCIVWNIWICRHKTCPARDPTRWQTYKPCDEPPSPSPHDVLCSVIKNKCSVNLGICSAEEDPVGC